MSNVERDISQVERLIVRKLDDELTEDEELQLNRELIRNPEARRLMEDYERIDVLASAALADALDEAAPPIETPGAYPAARRAYHRGWWLVPGAVAAALLAIIFARVNPPWQSNSMAGKRAAVPTQRVPDIPVFHERDKMQRNVSLDGEKVKRDTGREVIGIVGEDGNLYWIEIDRVRTFTRPGEGWAKPITLDEL